MLAALARQVLAREIAALRAYAETLAAENLSLKTRLDALEKQLARVALRRNGLAIENEKLAAENRKLREQLRAASLEA